MLLKIRILINHMVINVPYMCFRHIQYVVYGAFAGMYGALTGMYGTFAGMYSALAGMYGTFAEVLQVIQKNCVSFAFR